MKNIFLLTSLLCAASVYAAPKSVPVVMAPEKPVPGITTAENWKGSTLAPDLQIGALSGMNLYGSDINWSVLFAGAYQIAPYGWADDINDRVWLELEMGPAFFSRASTSGTGIQYSTHLRWDFTYNEEWAIYGLGGLGGYKLPNIYGSSFTIAPRFGVGALYQTKSAVQFRAELSHEFIGVGISIGF